MFVFGHAGIGSEMARPLVGAPARRGVLGALLLGTLLPDLVDKPLYYGLVLATGRHAAELGLVSGTRSFGHTALAMLAVLLLGVALRRRPLVALGLGMATHLLLDEVGDLLNGAVLGPGTAEYPSTLCAILFPLYGARFPVAIHEWKAHLLSLGSAYVIGGELVGAALLAWRFAEARRRRVAASAAGSGLGRGAR